MPETVTAERTEQQPGTQPTVATPAFDPVDGQDFEPSTSERAASGETGDGGAAGKSATTQPQPGQAETGKDKPEGSDNADAGAGTGDVDELEEQLRAFEGKPKDDAAGTEGKKPKAEEEVEISPEALRAEIEASAQEPTERLENLLKKVGGMANNLGTERKSRKAAEQERDGYKQAFEKVAGMYEWSETGEIKGLNRAVLQKVLDQHGLEVVAKGQRQVQTKAGQKYDADLVHEVAATLGVDDATLKEMGDDEKLNLIAQNLDAALDLRDKQKARGEQSRVQTEQAQAKFQQEMQVAAMALAKDVPHFKELQPVIESIYAELTKDQSGTRFMRTLHELAEYRRLRDGGLRALADKAKASERARITKAFAAVGMKPADLEAVLAGKQPSTPPAGRDDGGPDWIRG